MGRGLIEVLVLRIEGISVLVSSSVVTLTIVIALLAVVQRRWNVHITHLHAAPVVIIEDTMGLMIGRN